METRMYSVMKECRNFFVDSIEKKTFEIKNNIIDTRDTYKIGQYIMVHGSILNDGVYKINDTLITLEGTQNEIFKGTVCGLAVPRDFIELANDIAAFIDKNTSNSGNIISESYRGYSYTTATNKNGQVATWEDVFLQRLNVFRKMFLERI